MLHGECNTKSYRCVRAVSRVFRAAVVTAEKTNWRLGMGRRVQLDFSAVRLY